MEIRSSLECRLFSLQEKIKELDQNGGGICLAFSGGADSALLLKTAVDAGVLVHAVTFSTQLHPAGDLEEAKAMAKSWGALHHVIQIDEFSDPEILQNPPNRCYLCKKLLFTSLKDYAAAHGLQKILDGTNADDQKEYRPGLQALQELGIISPLAQLGISKPEVRELLALLGLEVSKKPASPCLATRLPYYTPLSKDLLQRIGAGEVFLKEAGFPVCRLRVHGEVVRLEIPVADFSRMLEQQQEITARLQAMGFGYITLDLEGFRSGSMDRAILSNRKTGGKESWK